MSKFKVTIEGMSCMHCVGHVKKAFEECSKLGSMDVKIGEAVIDGDISEAEIKDIIEDEGYDVIKIEKI